MLPITFPFSAIVGQEALKTALLLNAVDPTLGGVLIRGHKGAGKSTAARALAGLLPTIKSIKGCPYHCDPDQPHSIHPDCHDKIVSQAALATFELPTPMVELPLSATEDRIIGTLNIEAALKSGKRQYEPGLLAGANRGILYVDEVNLLADHLVDLLLDVAASGVNIVERESVRFIHPARFMLVGTMNPEEGELRPQFLDRFGLSINIRTLDDSEQRKEIIRRRIAFEQNPDSFIEAFQPEEDVLRQQIQNARNCTHKIAAPDAIIESAVEMAINSGAQGHRTEITLIKAATALAALLDKKEISSNELYEAARLCLPHRLDTSPLDRPEDIDERVEDLLAKSLGIKPDRESALPDDAMHILDNHGFPGSAAAGSMLFTYLKKKIQTAHSSRITTSS